MSNKTEKYTPGPWVKGYSNFDGALAVWPIIPIGPEEHFPICKVAPVENTTDEDHANANLIAAAPELLEALEFYVIGFEEMKQEFPFIEGDLPCMQKAKAAIKKAHGGKYPELTVTAHGEKLTDEEKETINQVVDNMVRNDEIGLKLLEALKFCKGVIEANGVWDLSEKMALEKAKEAIEMAESQLPIPSNGGYTSAETNCPGCMGPCGRCQEAKGDNMYKEGDRVRFIHSTERFDGEKLYEGEIVEYLGNRTYRVSAENRCLTVNETDFI
jgi:hypothetical protein